MPSDDGHHPEEEEEFLHSLDEYCEDILLSNRRDYFVDLKGFDAEVNFSALLPIFCYSIP